MIKVKAGVKQMSVKAVITRADGRVVDLGMISGYHRNPIVNWFWQVRIWINGVLSHKSRAG